VSIDREPPSLSRHIRSFGESARFGKNRFAVIEESVFEDLCTLIFFLKRRKSDQIHLTNKVYISVNRSPRAGHGAPPNSAGAAARPT
jgi:hypothetical protein